MSGPATQAGQPNRVGQPAAADFAALGCAARLLVVDPAALPDALAVTRAEVAAIDAACSRFRPDSELSRLNAAAGQAPMAVSPLLAEALAVALRAADLTDGDVDPTLGRQLAALGYDRDFAEVPPDGPAVTVTLRRQADWRDVWLDPNRLLARLPGGVALDLGATAKALAADRAAAAAAARAGCGVLVSLGGDVSVAGVGPDGGWRVSIADRPDAQSGGDPAGEPNPTAAVPPAVIPTVAIHSGGLATSGTMSRAWRRGGRSLHHILDPLTGDVASPCWRTVSVAAGSCVDANIASTAAMVRGPAAVGWLTARRLPGRLVHLGGAVRLTAGWPAGASA